MSIKCPECHAGISDMAEKCLFCGHNMKEHILPITNAKEFMVLRIVSWIFFIGGFTLFFSTSASISPSNTLVGISVLLIVAGIMGIMASRIGIGKEKDRVEKESADEEKAERNNDHNEKENAPESKKDGDNE